MVISDFDMPTMRGTILADTLSEMPFILVSGREDTISAAIPYENIRKVLIKPYDKNDLKWALNMLFAQE